MDHFEFVKTSLAKPFRLHLHYAWEILKWRFHSENASNLFLPHYAGEIWKRNNHRSFWIGVWEKLGKGNPTSFPGSLSSASLCRWEKDPGCSWSRDHPDYLGGKKICWVGGVAEYFDCCCGKLCGFQNLEQSLKKLPALSGSKSDFADEEGYIISAVSKI